MPINMTDYKMIVHERVYNVLQIILDFDRGPAEDGTQPQPKFIDAVYIDEDGVIKTMRDEAWCFQFVRRNGGTANGKTNNMCRVHITEETQMKENVCVDCKYYERCGKPERYMKCMGYEERQQAAEETETDVHD